MIADQIEEMFRRDYDSGMTQEELARKYHTSQQSVSLLLGGRRPFSGLSLATVDRMFPGASIRFAGEQAAGVVGDHSISVAAGGVNNTVTLPVPGGISDRILKAVIDSGMTAEEKIGMLRMLAEDGRGSA